MKIYAVVFAGLLSVSASAFGQSSATQSPTKSKAALEPFARESDNQTRVSGVLSQLVSELGELVSDAQSNQVYAQADGDALQKMTKSLRSTNRDRVLMAASELRKAIENSPERALHVKEAGGHVHAAQLELTYLLRQANALMLEDTIGQEIQDIMRDQRDLSRRTAQAARDKLQEQAPLVEPTQLAQEQRQLAKRIKKLKEAMQQAMEEDLTDESREKLQKAQEIAEEQQLEEKEQQAVDDLDNEELADAFEEQEQALNALSEMADQLSDVQRLPSDAAIEALAKLLQNQTALRKETAALSEEDFNKQASELQLKQLNLARELPAQSKAAAAMAEAASQLEKTAQQAAVAAQMEAEAALGAALEEAMGPGPGVPGAKGDAGTDDKGDGDSDKDEEGQGNMGKGKKGKSKKPGPPTPDSPPDEDGKPNENAAIEPTLAKNTPGRTTDDPKAGGERIFEKTRVEGALPASTSSTWASLSNKERDALSENFARELPREFREMLKVYYEELAK